MGLYLPPGHASGYLDRGNWLPRHPQIDGGLVMTRCTCPPGGPYSAQPCCRGDRCPESRCLHPGPTSRELLAELEDTYAMLRATKDRRDRLRSDLAETQSTVEALVVEVERLESALLTSVRGIGHPERHPERENGCEGAVEAVQRAWGDAPDSGG